MSVHDFLLSQREQIQTIEDNIRTVLDRALFYGNRRSMLENATRQLQQFREHFDDDQTRRLKQYLRRGLTHAKALRTFFRYGNEEYKKTMREIDVCNHEDTESEMDTSELRASYVLGEYVRLVKQGYEHHIQRLVDGETPVPGPS